MESLFKYLFNDPKVEKLIGGDINEVFKVIDADRTVVLKVNSKADFPKMFNKEKAGLEVLNESFRTPNVYRTGQFEDLQFLELEYFSILKENDSFWVEFAQKLALTHQKSKKNFGFEENNFIGSLVQINVQKPDWNTFLIENRLNPMIEMAVNSGEVNYVEAKIIEQFYARLNDIYPIEEPSLIHGDLWSGNYLSTDEGPVLIDPAAYYGHREMDLAMMKLFGGFDESVFHLYNEIFTLEKGWELRVAFNQLYPLLVHVNLFGRSYWDKVQHILKQFS